MKKLEDFLSEGIIKVGYVGCCLSALFLPYDRRKLSVQVLSDHGMEHLLLVLKAKLHEEPFATLLLDAAHAQHPHSMGVWCSPFDHFIRHRTMTIALCGEGVQISCAQLSAPSIKHPPGEYSAVVCATTLDEGLRAILAAEFRQSIVTIS